MAQDTTVTIELLKIRAINAQDMRTAISQVEKFTGEAGELGHFIKDGERLSLAIDNKAKAGWLDAATLRAALVGRVRRQVLNVIQSDTNTTWDDLKCRLKRAYGGGRWAPEEDLIMALRESKGTRQSTGSFAAKLITWRNKILDKLSELPHAPDTEAMRIVLERVLKVHLTKETGRTLEAGKSFLEAAQSMVEEGEKELEVHTAEPEEGEWVRVRRSGRRDFNSDPERSSRPKRPNWRTPRASVHREAGRRETTGRRENGPREATKRCYECGKVGHLAAKCSKVKCFECNDLGHVARHCPYVRRWRPDLGEPMEVNFHRVKRENQRREEEESEVDSDDDSASEEEPPPSRKGSKTLTAYAAVLQNNRVGRKRV